MHKTNVFSTPKLLAYKLLKEFFSTLLVKSG